MVFAGFQGLYTGVKKGAYSISYNLRNKEEDRGFVKSMVMAYIGHKKWSMILKKTFEKWETFDEAVAFLDNSPAINPCYLTVCGLDSGVKITRDRLKSRHDWVYADDSEESKTWFDVQTNWDTFAKTPERDLGRLEKAKEMLDINTFDNMNEHRMLYNVLNIYPVWNKETVFCAFMDPTEYRCTVMIPDEEGQLKKSEE